MNIEKMLFNNLLNNEEFCRRAIPFIRTEYFGNYDERTVFSLIDDYIRKYNRLPSKDALLVDLQNISGLSEDTFRSAAEIISAIEPDNTTQLEWLVDQTEKFCQEKAVYQAIMKSIEILDNKNDRLTKDAIPSLLSDALAVSFDSSIGHEFLDEAEARWEYYNQKVSKIPFDLDLMNRVTRGGLERKTLNVILAGTNVGKSLAMCHMAAGHLAAGLNVLYITMEMAEEKIAERIDANLLNIPIEQMSEIPKETYLKKVERMRSRTKGRLVIKEYPTASAGSANFRHLLTELKIKKNFVPDVVYVDYINICISSRLKGARDANSYTLIKAIAEELRGLAVEFNIALVTATQTTRSGFSNSDPELGDTAESFGLPATADFMLAMVSTEELEALGQVLFKQLKNRYSDKSTNKRFVVGIDRSRMRLFDVEQSAQEGIVDGPAPESSRTDGAKKFDRGKFSGLK